MFKDQLLGTQVRGVLVASGAMCFAMPAAFAQATGDATSEATEATQASERISIIGSRIRHDGLDSDTAPTVNGQLN